MERNKIQDRKLNSLKRLETIQRHLVRKVKAPPSVQRLKVCIIGAGPIGINCTKYFKQYHDVDTFEARDDIGGLWNYTIISELTHPDLQNDEYFKLYGNLNPSIYENMTANLPKFLMSFRDFPVSDKYSMMMRPEEFQAYLYEYADNFGVKQWVKLHSLVTHVKLIQNMTEAQLSEFNLEQRKRKFAVSVKNTVTRETIKETYDHIVWCSGRNSKKYIPPFKGKDNWDGVQLHMHEFRTIEKEFYENKTVLVVGSNIVVLSKF